MKHHVVSLAQPMQSWAHGGSDLTRVSLSIVIHGFWGHLGPCPLPAELLAVMDSGEGQSLSSDVYSMKISKFMVTKTILVELGEYQKQDIKCTEGNFGG